MEAEIKTKYGHTNMWTGMKFIIEVEVYKTNCFLSGNQEYYVKHVAPDVNTPFTGLGVTEEEAFQKLKDNIEDFLNYEGKGDCYNRWHGFTINDIEFIKKDMFKTLSSISS